MRTDVTRLRVGLMPYLNSVAFYRALDASQFDLVSLPPRAMAAAVERGALDAGPLPLAEVLRMGAALRPIGDFCVATGERANSVLLLSKLPAESLGGKAVAVTSHTATSIQMLRVLFADRWKTSPGKYVELDEPHDAKLVIGDEALRLRRPSAEYPHVYDLGAEWRLLTGLPFVFAVWAARADVDKAAADQLTKALGHSVETAMSQVDAIAREHKSAYMTEADVASYVRSFIYKLGTQEKQAVEEFKARLSRLPQWRPGEAMAVVGRHDGARLGGNKMLSHIREKVADGERVTQEEGLYLMSESDLLDLAPLAQAWRWRHNPEPNVTFVVDTNLNYTNICDAYCSFCAFYRTDPSDPSAYTYTVEQIMDKIGRSVEKGVTTVLMQGGLNNALPFSYYTDMVRETVRQYPSVTPHYWSAPEIMKMCQVSGVGIRGVMQSLWAAGQRTMPGGGSEILSNRVKAEISRFKPKDTVDQWTQVHVEAHRVGFQTTATMMYGHVETDEDIVESLEHIRGVQDQAVGQPGGFTAFIPWSYKKSNTALAKKVAEEAGPNKYLRIIALSRIYLDNVPHIQASWFSEGRKTGQIALQFGADDFGGTLFDENVMLAAGFYNRTTVDEIKALIREAGFTPAQRTTKYEVVQVFAQDAPAKSQAASVGVGAGGR